MGAEAVFEELSPELIEEFLEDQRERGRAPGSLAAYRRNLLKLYSLLPDGKRLTAGTAAQWRARMQAEGVPPRSVNARLSALNSLCGYLGRREFQSCDFLDGPEIIQPELTRSEYLRLLGAAKALEKERTYFLIKVLGGVGLRVQELPQLTAEALRAGEMELSYHNSRCRRSAAIPPALREELLDFAGREGFQTGPVFRTGEGRPVSRTYVCKLLGQISGPARVAPEKATPRCLWNMYQSTRQNILRTISVLADQVYDRLLAQEQQLAGWDA